tara:strand:- start:122 stop:592 length:471 start_codon:yes stop_codon:yes gene_type:complete
MDDVVLKKYYIIDRRLKNGWCHDENRIPTGPNGEDESSNYTVIPIPEEDRKRATMIEPFTLDQYMSEDSSGNFTVDLNPETFGTKIKRQNIQGIIQERNKKIAETDWTQLADVYMDGVTRGKWNDYRRQLRDIPTTGITYDEDFFPVSVNWPEPPQ